MSRKLKPLCYIALGIMDDESDYFKDTLDYIAEDLSDKNQFALAWLANTKSIFDQSALDKFVNILKDLLFRSSAGSTYMEKCAACLINLINTHSLDRLNFDDIHHRFGVLVTRGGYNKNHNLIISVIKLFTKICESDSSLLDEFGVAASIASFLSDTVLEFKTSLQASARDLSLTLGWRMHFCLRFLAVYPFVSTRWGGAGGDGRGR